jgi:hypothetical protein
MKALWLAVAAVLVLGSSVVIFRLWKWRVFWIVPVCLVAGVAIGYWSTR